MRQAPNPHCESAGKRAVTRSAASLFIAGPSGSLCFLFLKSVLGTWNSRVEVGQRAASADKEGLEQVEIRARWQPASMPRPRHELPPPSGRNEDPCVARASPAAEEERSAGGEWTGTWGTLGPSPQPSGSPRILPPQERFPCETHRCRRTSCAGCPVCFIKPQFACRASGQ